MSKTIKVRIAVAVTEHGYWAAGGGHNWADGDAQACVIEAIDIGGEQLHWIEAEVPLPEITTIQGIVEEATR